MKAVPLHPAAPSTSTRLGARLNSVAPEGQSSNAERAAACKGSGRILGPGFRLGSRLRMIIPEGLALQADRAVARNGLLSTIVYMCFATLVAICTYALNEIANAPVSLGTIEQAFFHNIYDIPVNTLLQGTTTTGAINDSNQAIHVSYGTLSLSDLQYDTCGLRDPVCGEKLRANTERVFKLLAQSFSLIPTLRLPDFTASPDNIEVKYITQLTGYNFPAVQFAVPNDPLAVVCIVRRGRYRIAQEAVYDIDSFAMCSRRTYDRDWICENEVALTEMTYVMKIKLGKVTYLGRTERGELYYNPGNTAKLNGGDQGNGLLSCVISIDEYNGGIVQSAAPWDVVPAYLCKGTFNFDTYTGMRWQGQGIVSMTWQSDSLMLSNSVVLWTCTAWLALLQVLYLRHSSVCMIPVGMAKSVIGPMVLGAACIGNYHLQVLTTYLTFNQIPSWHNKLYQLCGPVMFASAVAIMSGTTMQLFYNPLLISPSYVLTVISVINWGIVFSLEAYVFPKQSVMLARDCGLPTSTACTYYSATLYNYYLSPLIALATVVVGIIVVAVIRSHGRFVNPPKTNTVLRLFCIDSIYDVVTSGSGGCVLEGEGGVNLRVDAGILLNKNLICVSNTAIVRTGTVQYVVFYRLMPRVMARFVSRAVGSCFVIRVNEDLVTKETIFQDLDNMNLSNTSKIPASFE